jgi:xanthine dehydrogenase small subunit
VKKSNAAGMKLSHAVQFYLNGQLEQVEGADVFMSLAEFLRRKKGLTGTKIVCAEGDCGACTVLRARGDSVKKGFESVNSCIALVGQQDGMHLVSIEGIAEGNQLSPVQTAMVECHGSQCGYCTPGFVMAMTDWLEKSSKKENAKNYLTGNLCRCTGYEPILKACEHALEDSKKTKNSSLRARYLTAAPQKAMKARFQQSLEVAHEGCTFFAPQSLSELKNWLKKQKAFTVVGAGTDLGVQANKGKREWASLLSLHKLSEFQKIQSKGRKVQVGSQVSLSELRRFLEKKDSKLSEALDLFASPQIKNVATLAGNMANASPIADTPPLMLVLEGKVNGISKKGAFSIPVEKFFLGYRKTSLPQGAVITSIGMDHSRTSSP